MFGHFYPNVTARVGSFYFYNTRLFSVGIFRPVHEGQERVLADCTTASQTRRPASAHGGTTQDEHHHPLLNVLIVALSGLSGRGSDQPWQDEGPGAQVFGLPHARGTAGAFRILSLKGISFLPRFCLYCEENE